MGSMSKQEQFLWAVQTIVMANSIDLSVDSSIIPGQRGKFTATVTIVALALHASERIPSDMRVIDAAYEFCKFTLPNLRENGATCPAWFAD
ncbi:hypothetical protein R70006_06330 [Paraburkholderia domus]|nr:hypothetical protein [Burkholderia sp. R-70006]CAE6823691.1 hypothetical protein R70006_06330 [Paraburkholderia domus]